jgi:hypothetical protein
MKSNTPAASVEHMNKEAGSAWMQRLLDTLPRKPSGCHGAGDSHRLRQLDITAYGAAYKSADRQWIGTGMCKLS